MTGTEMPRCGSIIVAKPKPMLIAIVCPAMISASKIIWRQKPIATPIRTSCSTVKPVAIDKSNGCVTGISGEITAVTATLSAMRTRGETRRAPNTGATMMTPAMRKNGHTLMESTLPSSASMTSSGICMLNLSATECS